LVSWENTRKIRVTDGTSTGWEVDNPKRDEKKAAAPKKETERWG
jgi:hypothetical protein